MNNGLFGLPLLFLEYLPKFFVHFLDVLRHISLRIAIRCFVIPFLLEGGKDLLNFQVYTVINRVKSRMFPWDGGYWRFSSSAYQRILSQVQIKSNIV